MNQETHNFETEAECHSCNGTGIYVGMAERDGFGVVCSNCKGTGKETLKLSWKDFVGRRRTTKVKQVLQCNPGICVGLHTKDGSLLSLQSFGGMSYADFFAGKPFEDGMEMREYTCPRQWYQSADYDRIGKEWTECTYSSFRDCNSWKTKNECWKRWDKEKGKK